MTTMISTVVIGANVLLILATVEKETEKDQKGAGVINKWKVVGL